VNDETDYLADTRARARVLLQGYAAGGVDPAPIRPRESDYDRVFEPMAVGAMRAHFERLWASGPVPAPQPGQTEVHLHVALAAVLATDNPFSRNFPGGYQRVAPFLIADTAWVAWTFTAPGQDRGMAYDGLVRIDDRFAWFPKPWRARALPRPP
jgi:hypothetical protein